MSTKTDTPATKMAEDGLRYRKKAPGTPFAAAGAFGHSTMSCFECGKHRPRAELETKKLLGKSHQVCKGGCPTS
jgi:hypothetical protein